MLPHSQLAFAVFTQQCRSKASYMMFKGKKHTHTAPGPQTFASVSRLEHCNSHQGLSNYHCAKRDMFTMHEVFLWGVNSLCGINLCGINTSSREVSTAKMLKLHLLGLNS